MKALILFILFGMSNAFALDNCFTGSWYDREHDGEGVNLEVMDGFVGGYFYTWYGKHRNLYIMKSDNDIEGGAALTVLASTYPNRINWAGDSGIVVIDNNTIEFSYLLKWDWDRTDDFTIPWCFTNCRGAFTYTRLTQPIACD